MRKWHINRRTVWVLAALIPLVSLFGYVAVTSGPLTPVPVTVTTVQTRAISPALFGIGTVEARYTHKIGPTMAGRIKQVDVHVGDKFENSLSVKR